MTTPRVETSKWCKIIFDRLRFESLLNPKGLPQDLPDVSTQGWGVSCEGMRTGGPWTPSKKTHHINYLELLAGFLAMKSFADNHCTISILLLLDKITMIGYLNRMKGAHSGVLSERALEIWKRCLERRIVIHAEHLPGRECIHMDRESCHVKDSSDWRLKRKIFWAVIFLTTDAQVGYADGLNQCWQVLQDLQLGPIACGWSSAIGRSWVQAWSLVLFLLSPSFWAVISREVIYSVTPAHTELPSYVVEVYPEYPNYNYRFLKDC